MAIDFPLSEILSTFCNVNAIEMASQISRNLGNYDEDVLRRQLKDAIENGSISTEDYERLTNDSYDSQEELTEWLTELWEIIFQVPFQQ